MVVVVRKAQSLSPWTIDALRVLGRQISSERRLRQWTQESLAERAGISSKTLIGIEKGAPGAAIGTVFELASLLGIPLVGAAEPTARQVVDTRFALLPTRVHAREREDDDDF
ncbi:helix-turn-helix transcriptional regulator [Leifsonia sp. Root112D2]|uniref:helix-turn-helix transcriptional regulator n=1 Tax=Leifsonia sp. Root112D2 TaxID=1736426 RepID=UPI0009EB2CB1|nr:helix-turn-helix transcriptional regulator [Leifsonia sp. Root112D2]